MEAILQATRNLAVRDGLERVTTNAVAKTAGVSIGSLYQYFDNLEAIIAELSRRHVESVLELMFAEVDALAHESLEVGTRRLIRLMVEIHRQDPELHRVIAQSWPSLAARTHLSRVEQQLMRTAVAYLEHHRERLVVDDLQRAAFVAIGSIEALTHNAVVMRPELLEGEALVDDISRMVLGYLTGKA